MSFVLSLDVMAKRRKGTLESIYEFEADQPVNGLAKESRGNFYFSVKTDTVNDDGSTTTTYALWLSCGSGAEEIYSFDEGAFPLNFVSNRGKLYFIVQTTTTVTNDDGTTTTTVNDVLWVSDGTSDGTEAIITLDSTVTVSTALTSNRGKVYFGTTETVTNDDGSTTTTNSLWCSDGTDTGTGSYYTFEASQMLHTNLTTTKGKLFFAVRTSTTNDDGSTTLTDSLWVSDGTDSGTEAYFDFETDSSVISSMTTMKGKLYFFVLTTVTNDDGSTTNKNSLYMSCGSGAELVHEFDSTVVPTINNMTTTKGKLYFPATTTITNDDGTTSTTESLWISDGADGTESAYDFNAGQTFASSIVSTKGKLFFMIQNVVTNDDGSTTTTYQFWNSDSKGSASVIDESFDASQYLYNIGNARGMVFFFVDNTVTADDGSVSHTYELYKYK
jgi:hypothetical protein